MTTPKVRQRMQKRDPQPTIVYPVSTTGARRAAEPHESEIELVVMVQKSESDAKRWA